ncbi:MAG: HU family DNA-binding protein [Magnetococcales bacterium]|nr:HU family DNA-binding protein [Magnetococcales bacterium]
MNRSDIINAISDRHGMSVAEAATTVSTALDTMADSLAQGDRVELREQVDSYLEEPIT